MSISSLDPLFKPNVVAVVGASNNPGSLGFSVMENMLAGKFRGAILPVNSKCRSVQGVLCYPSVDNLPLVPDLALLCTPPQTVPALIESLGRSGTRVVVVMTAEWDGEYSQSYKMLAAAKAHGVRLIGPNSTGIQVPGIGLNAGWIPTTPRPGTVAMLSQSGSFTAGVMQWALAEGIGFSHVISAGDALDVDLGDFLDWLAVDHTTRAVVLFIRSLKESRKFLSAARAVARLKPVLAIRAGRRGAFSTVTDGEPRPEIEHDIVFDAALRRAGILRVYGTDELFEAVETLACVRQIRGERVAIVGNGSGPGDIAADIIVYGGGKLAVFNDATRAVLATASSCGSGRSGEPIDLGRDGNPTRYGLAVNALLQDPGVDVLLVMHTPNVSAPGEAVAEAACGAAKGRKSAVLACWLGNGGSGRVREIFSSAGIPCYPTPDKAAHGFLHLARYQRNHDMLMQVPRILPRTGDGRDGVVHELIYGCLEAGRNLLDEAETAQVLRTAGIPVLDTLMVADAGEAAAAACKLGFPVALRLAQPTVARRFTVAGSSINLASAEAVRTSAETMLAIRDGQESGMPARLVVQKMTKQGDTIMLAAGMAVDPFFGPVVWFGTGGVARRLPGDYVVALPPLNSSLASELINRTRFGQLAASIGGEGVRDLLVALSDMVIRIPEISAIELNPILLDGGGAVVLDARMSVERQLAEERRLAIRPYPVELEETLKLADNADVLLRPVRPEDEPAYARMLEHLTKEDMRLRFWGVFHGVPMSVRSQLIHIDYDRDMVFVAVRGSGDAAEILGMVNIMADPRAREGEYGVVIRSDCKGLRLGRVLMDKMIRYGRERGLDAINGLVRADNEPMLRLCRKLGFVVLGRDEEEDDILKLRLTLERVESQGWWKYDGGAES